MKKIFKVDHGTYPFEVLVCVGVEHQDILDWLWKKAKMKLDEEEKEKLWMEGVGRTLMFKNGFTILRIDYHKDEPTFHATLAHEIFHAVELLFDRIDIKHHPEYTSEAFAYQIQYLTGNILVNL